MSRFFIEDRNILGDNILIKGEDVNHIKNVLRSRVGDKLILCNGKCTDFQAKIKEFRKEEVVTVIEGSSVTKTEPSLDITLFQGIPKGNKMDFIIQKSVELGVKKIIPIITERTVLRFNGEGDKLKKTLRWKKIALEAAKQCNRGIIPQINTPLEFANNMKVFGELDHIVIPYEEEKILSLKNFVEKVKNSKNGVDSIGLFIGPEGGFSESEINESVKHGAISVTLGPRILRTETASLAVLAILIYEFDNPLVL